MLLAMAVVALALRTQKSDALSLVATWYCQPFSPFVFLFLLVCVYPNGLEFQKGSELNHFRKYLPTRPGMCDSAARSPRLFF